MQTPDEPDVRGGCSRCGFGAAQGSAAFATPTAGWVEDRFVLAAFRLASTLGPRLQQLEYRAKSLRRC